MRSSKTMSFDLRQPCPQCPFRKSAGGYLHGDSAVEIANAVLHEDKTFACHKHITGRARNHQQCAGASAMVRKTGAANAVLQIAERLGLLDPDQLLSRADAMVYDSVEQMRDAHERSLPALSHDSSTAETANAPNTL